MKRILSVILVAFLVSGVYVPAFAVESRESGFDTLSIIMDDYYESTKPTTIFIRLTSDNDLVRNTCEAFIAAGRASVRSDEYSVSELADLSQSQVRYRQSEYQYLAEINDATDVTILSDNLLFSDFEAEINDTSATASIVEKYTYYTNDFDGYNFRMRKYTFSLAKQEDGSWIITGVETDDPWETSNFSYEPLDAADVIAVANTVVPVELNASSSRLGEKATEATTSLYKWTYNPSAAVEYAELFCSASSTAGGNNPLFPITYDASGDEANCQNFASQCVWAGLIGDCDIAVAMTSRTEFPAVSASKVGSSATNVWCYDSTSTAPAINGCSWYSSTRFAKMIDLSSTSTEGPFGNTHYGNLRYADVGDVIHYNSSHATVNENSTLNHAMFVTDATGSVGSRTMTNLKIAANSSPTNTAYVALTAYAAGYQDQNFSTCVIADGYYRSPRNFN